MTGTCCGESIISVADWKLRIEAAAAEVFSIMVGVDLRMGAVPDPPLSMGYMAMIGLAGAPCGVFRVQCDTGTALEIANHMLGTPGASPAQAEVSDAMGEICNMVAGCLKARLPAEGAGCLMSVPTVVRGTDYEVRSLNHDFSIEIAMLHDQSTILFRLELQSNSAPTH